MKKLLMMIPLLLVGLVLAGCGTTQPTDADTTATGQVADEDIAADVDAEVDLDENDGDDTEDETDTVAVAGEGEDFCELYLDMMQCLIDTYPEEYQDDPDADMTQLRAAVYSQDIPDDQRQSFCQFSFAMTQQSARESDEYEGEDDCGLLTTDVGEIDEGFMGGMAEMIKAANQ